MFLRQSAAMAILAAAAILPSISRAQQTDEAAAKEAERIARWEPQIAAFEKRDAADPPAQGGIVFVGSSTIGLWDLPKSFPGMPATNRGFGGSQLADTRAHLPRLVLKHRPRLVVLHAGGNDLNAGKSAAEAFADLQAIQQALHAALPECRLAYIGIKPTLKRVALRDKERELNALIRSYLAEKPGATFIQTEAPFCDSAGQPRADLLRDDLLHLNDAGYAVLSDLVRPVLMAAMAQNAAPAGPPAEFQKREYQSANGDALKYVVYVPKNLTLDKPAPFLIFLHGSCAECVTHERILRESNLQFWHAYGRNVQREPTILIAPVGGTGGWTSEARQQAVFGIIDALLAEFPIDRRRIYLQGFSLGAAGTWRYLQERPTFFAAANPQALGGRSLNPERIKHIPIWATVGSDDRRGVMGMTANVAAIRAANGDARGGLTEVTDVNPRFTIFPNTNHGGAQVATQRMPGFMDWMYAQINDAGATPIAEAVKQSRARPVLQDGDRLLFVGGRQIRFLERHVRWSLGRAEQPLNVRGRTRFEYNATLREMSADRDVTDLIRSVPAKFVVLASGQIQDGNPAVVANPSVEDLATFIDMIQKANKQAVLFMTWARNPAGRNNGLEEFRRATAEIVGQVRELQKQRSVLVMPSGLIFYDLTVDPPDALAGLREEFLFNTPNFAEGNLGMLVNVSAFYAATTGKSPVGLPMWDAYEPAVVKAIQERVWQIVQDWQAGKVVLKPARRAAGYETTTPIAQPEAAEPTWCPLVKEGDRLFFIGNSFTAAQGGLFNHLRNVAGLASPRLKLETHARIYPGTPLSRMYRNEVVQEIKSARNAVVVATSGGDADMKRFRDLIAQSGSKMVVHLTWGRNPTINNNRLAGFREETARIAEAGMAFEKEAGVPVVPCGLIFWDLIADPPLPGLREDFVFVHEDIHQNSLGTLANVSAHYAVMTGRSPIGLPMWEPYDPRLVKAVQERAWQIVQDWKAGKVIVKPAPQPSN